MSNFGFLRLRVVQPYEAAFRQARSAVGGAPVLTAAKEFPTVAEAVADCSFVVGTTAVRHRVPQQPLLALADGAKLIHRHCPAGKVALLFGNEKFGLSNDDLAHCHALLHIPTREKHLSMNLGQAVAVCLYELSREPRRRGTSKTQAVRSLAAPPKLKPASAGEVERVTESLLDALRLSGYIKPQTESSVTMNIRRLLRRQKLTGPDAELWLGMLRQILWKLHR
jgi:TrmH family RNA methyltransferase